MKKIYYSLLIIFAFFIINNTNVFASDFSTTDFMNTVKQYNSGASNFWIARDPKTGDLYFPGMSRGSVGNYYSYNWDYIKVNDKLGLYLRGGDTWVLNKYDFKTGNISTVSLNEVGWKDFFQLETKDRVIHLIYSYNDITFQKYDNTQDIDGMKTGDVYFKKTTELVLPQNYVTDVSGIPEIMNNVIQFVLPFVLFVFGAIVVIYVIKKIIYKFM